MILRFLPRRALRGFANAAGRIWVRVSPSSRRLGLSNLDLIYGDSLSPAEKEAVLLASIQSILRSVLDHFYFFCRPAALERHVIIAEADRVRLAELANTGAVILSAHLGNWEILLSLLSGFAPVNVLARSQEQFDRIVVAARARFGTKTVHDSSSEVKELSGRLRQGEMVFCILDRNVSHAKGVVSDFMGQPAFTPYFPVNMAYFGGVPVIPAFLVEEGEVYRLVLGEAITVEPLATKLETYRHYTALFLAAIEKQVRQTPEQWFWAHKRWARPKGEVQG
ncbi:MAG: lipid A biosynthesis lauroyl acyltransferase [Deltaproteobacteria bacterium ADurb.Bin510]|nr:MAG: lipid A biosynthesis lauroyl acyltransferase [Deltaproteobacteria bacterium ADurb.Bin510]